MMKYMTFPIWWESHKIPWFQSTKQYIYIISILQYRSSTVSDEYQISIKKHQLNDPRNDPMLQFPTQFPGSLHFFYLDRCPVVLCPCNATHGGRGEELNLCRGRRSQNHWWSVNGRFMVVSWSFKTCFKEKFSKHLGWSSVILDS